METLLTDIDKQILKEYIRKIKNPNCYVEIGTYQGGSALIASEITKQPVYSIDIVDNLDSELKEKFNFILGDSLEIVKNWDKYIGLLFIDGDHTRVGEDFEMWKNKVVDGGYILFHDYCQHPEWNVVSNCDSIIEKYKNKLEILRIPLLVANERSSILVIKKLQRL